MSQNTARPDQRAKSGDEDVADPRARQSERRQAAHSGRTHRGVGQPGGVGPDEPDDGEVELIGDNDLSPADLGPAAPDATDPDADSGRVRKIAP